MSLLQFRSGSVIMAASGVVLFVLFLLVHSGRLTLQHEQEINIVISTETGVDLVQELPQEDGELPGSEVLYGVMIDAGSTGTRLHVFKFSRNGEDDIRLMSEMFESIEPGLSSYADTPEEGAASVQELVNIAENFVPADVQRRTPIALKATAGLRMLPEEKAQTLLDKVHKVFDSSPFLVRKDSVAIMDGLDEGLFAWFTVNFLIGALGSKEKVPTQGALDLGGGSTQITFSPRDKETLKSSPEGFVRPVTIFHQTYMLYVHSYLGFGLMAARLRMMGMETEDINSNPVTGSLSSACLPAHFQGAFQHSGVQYAVSGVSKSEAGFGACWAAAVGMLRKQIHQPDEIKQEPFYAFSYYFDRAKESGMIGEEGGSLQVSQFRQRAEEVCSTPLPDYPFMCMDLCYISALLEEGFGFNPTNVLMLRKKIQDVETSWALGATFQMLS